MSDTATPADNGQPEPEAEPRREPVFNLPKIVLAIIVLCAGVHLLRVYVLTVDQDVGLLVRAAFIPVRYSGQYVFDFYAFSSPFTYTFLHGGFMHLAINMVWLAAFGSPLANRIGALRFALFFAVTGLAAAFFFWAIHPLTQAPLVGASGAISGMMGAAARFAFRIDRSSGKSAFGGPPLPFSVVFRSRGRADFPRRLDGDQSGDRLDRGGAGRGRPDRLGGSYRRLPRRLSRPPVLRPAAASRKRLGSPATGPGSNS